MRTTVKCAWCGGTGTYREGERYWPCTDCDGSGHALVADCGHEDCQDEYERTGEDVCLVELAAEEAEQRVELERDAAYEASCERRATGRRDTEYVPETER